MGVILTDIDVIIRVEKIQEKFDSKESLDLYREKIKSLFSDKLLNNRVEVYLTFTDLPKNVNGC